jgi:hypothetical protein
MFAFGHAQGDVLDQNLEAVIVRPRTRADLSCLPPNKLQAIQQVAHLVLRATGIVVAPIPDSLEQGIDQSYLGLQARVLMSQTFFPHSGLPGLAQGRYLVFVVLAKVPEGSTVGLLPAVFVAQNLNPVIGQSLSKPVQ